MGPTPVLRPTPQKILKSPKYPEVHEPEPQILKSPKYPEVHEPEPFVQSPSNEKTELSNEIQGIAAESTTEKESFRPSKSPTINLSQTKKRTLEPSQSPSR